MSKPIKITKSKALEMIAIIDTDDNSNLGVIKLGRFYYDITDVGPQEVLDFMNESNRRSINKIGATRI